jgi:hypothetical protein
MQMGCFVLFLAALVLVGLVALVVLILQWTEVKSVLLVWHWLSWEGGLQRLVVEWQWLWHLVRRVQLLWTRAGRCDPNPVAAEVLDVLLKEALVCLYVIVSSEVPWLESMLLKVGRLAIDVWSWYSCWRVLSHLFSVLVVSSLWQCLVAELSLIGWSAVGRKLMQWLAVAMLHIVANTIATL